MIIEFFIGKVSVILFSCIYSSQLRGLFEWRPLLYTREFTFPSA